MANVAHGKKILAIAVLACLCAALVSVPAYAMYYVHGEDHVAQSSKGAVEVCLTVDATAAGEGVYTALVFVPAGSTAADCLSEGIVASNSHNGLEALHDYSTTNLGDYLSGKTWTCTVYQAGSQNPGTQTTHDENGTDGEDTPLERYDNVVFTVA